MKTFSSMIDRFFRPSMWMMKRFSYSKKQFLIALFFLVPLLYALYVIDKSDTQQLKQIQQTQADLLQNRLLYQTVLLLHEVRQVNEKLSRGEIEQGALQAMLQKGIIERNKDAKAHITAEIFLKAKNIERNMENALLQHKSELVNAYIYEYAVYLYERMAVLEVPQLEDDEAYYHEIKRVLSEDLPLSSYLLVQSYHDQDKSRPEMVLAKLTLLSQTFVHRLEQTPLYTAYFEQNLNVYQRTLRAYERFVYGYQEQRVEEKTDELLSLQKSLYTLLQENLDIFLVQKRQQMQRESIAFLVIVLVMMSIGLYLLVANSWQLQQTLQGLFERIQAINAGDFLPRESVQSRDELGVLEKELNGMFEHLQSHYALLDGYKYAVDESAIVVKTDTNGVITYVNEAYERISAYTKEELIGSTHKLIKSKNTSEEQIKELWEYIRNKKVYKTIFENIAKNGKSFYVESTIIPLLDSYGEIREYISIMFDISPLYKQKVKLQSQLYKDSLTGLPNRLKLLEDIALTQASKLVVMNIDGFKEINTIYGENIGDLTLQKMAKEIKGALNTRHLKVYKLSADEFAIMAGEEISINHFKEDVALLSHYLNHIKLSCDEHIISVRLSLGAAISELHHSQRPLISMADMALKEAKRRMRPYLFYHDMSQVDEDLEKNYELVQLIEKSINEDKVSCCYQGIVNAKTGQIEKYETLMRLEENGKKISPERFVSIAKRTRFYPLLTQKVVQEAIMTFMPRQESVSLNLSIDDIMDDKTYFFILDLLRNCECAERIVFELLESEEIEFNERVLDFTTQVKKLGAKIAIDDFGSGYSNYAYLMQLGVDIIKIDASLIKHLDSDENSRLITQSIIDIAHALGMEVIAEYVHCEAIKEIVMEMGIDHMQGYYLHQPVNNLEA